MYLNDLAAMLRAGGMSVQEVANWQGRNHGSMAGVRSIVCHHTAGAATGNAPSLGVVTNGRSDLAGPLAQLFLARDGTVYVVSNGVAWHAGATINDSIYGNSWAIGIEAENTGSQPWPAEQVAAYAKLCALLCKHYGVDVSNVRGHKEICKPAGRKVDPAGLPGDMSGFRALVAGYVTGDGGDSSPAPMTSRIEIMERVTVKASPSVTTVRVRLPGGPNAKLIIRPASEGDANYPVWLSNIFAWGSDKKGVGQNPMVIPGYDPKIVFSREVALAGAVWADVQYSCNKDFTIDIVG